MLYFFNRLEMKKHQHLRAIINRTYINIYRLHIYFYINFNDMTLTPLTQISGSVPVYTEVKYNHLGE